jgi:hypothetical protein
MTAWGSGAAVLKTPAHGPLTLRYSPRMRTSPLGSPVPKAAIGPPYSITSQAAIMQRFAAVAWALDP